MLTVRSINKNLLDTNSPNLPPSFIAAAIEIRDGKAYHAGFVIANGGERHFFHFNVNEERIEFVDLPVSGWYVHREIVTLPAVLVTPFIVHCRKISKLSAPKWGCFFNGTYFKNGQLFNKDAEPYYLTCVGFCLSVLLGFDESENYIEWNDWNVSNSLTYNSDYVEGFVAQLKAAHPDLDETDLRANVRRVRPDEYLASAFLYSQPIRKKDTDEVINNVRLAIGKRKPLVLEEVEEDSGDTSNQANPSSTP